MRIIPLSEILQMENLEVIPSVQGKLIKLREYKTGENAKGPWSIQKGVISRDGVQVDVFFTGQEEVPKSYVNRDIVISCGRDGRDGKLIGVIAEDDDYNGKITRQIKVTGKGEVALLQGEGASEPPARQQQQPTQRQEAQKQEEPPAQRQQAPASTSSRDEPGSAAAIADVVGAANQLANLQILCYATVEDYVAQRYKHKTGKDMDEQAKNSAAMNMAIELERKGMQWKLPTTRAKLPAHPASTDPQPPTSENLF